MDSLEAARAVFQRVQSIDPDNAHKIVGYILIQDQAEKEMIRLAFGPDNLINSIIAIAKSELGLSSNTSSATNSSPSPRQNPSPIPLSPSSPWSTAGSSNPSLSYAAVVNGAPAKNSGDDFPLPEQTLDFLDQSPTDWGNGGHFHRRSFSVNDIRYGTEPCLYFSRGFCKNGSGCKFVHGGGGGFLDSVENPAAIVGSPRKLDAFEQYQQEVMRSKVAQQQQRLAAAQYIAGVNSPYNKLNFLQNEAQRTAAATLMMEEEFHKLNRLRFGRNDISDMGFGDSASGSRQIYLTFPADSTFKEEDVSNYFSIFGPVQDVRIPYQQKRMFGFVTFVYPDTVKIILAKGNPHFVCDSRVLVKPYKEKGKLQDRKQQNQLDRSEFSSSSPAGVDCREPFEMHVGPRMFYNNPELLRKKLEQEAGWQRALEFQRRRLMTLELSDLKNHPRYRQDSSVVSPPSVSHSDVSLNHCNPPSTNVASDEAAGENQGSPTASKELHEESLGNGDKQDEPEIKGSDVHESFEHALPDGLLASPTKSADELSIFNVAPPKPCLLEIPGVSSGHV